MSESSNSDGGIGFIGMLTIVFITLKLTGFIGWPWIWVLSPVWISVAMYVLMIVVFVTISEFKDHRKRKANRRSS